jgi:hypothetical protein
VTQREGYFDSKEEFQMSVSGRPLRIPLLSSIADDVGRDTNMVFYLLTIALTVLVLAVQTWGLVALVIAALTCVPVVFALLLWVTIP